MITATAKKTPSPVDRHVGSRVRMRRMMLGISQEKLGDAIGLTFQQVQKYEKGTNRIGSSRLQQIAQSLDCNVSWLFDGAPGNDAKVSPTPTFITDFMGSSIGMRVALGFVKLPAGTQRAIANLIEAMVEGRS